MGGKKKEKKDSTNKSTTSKTTTEKKKKEPITSNNRDTYDCISYSYTHYASGTVSGNYFTSKKDI